MIIQILLLLAGLALVVFGADLLVDGATSIARKAGVSEFVVGLTIVGFGTSMPELVVSMTGALEGLPDIAVGNVLGSNIVNSLLILGLSALIAPIAVSRQNRMRDIPFCLLVTFLFAFLGQNDLSRLDAGVFLAVFFCYMFVSFRDSDATEAGEGSVQVRPLGIAILFTLLGLGGLIFGGRLFVDSAVSIARLAGVSEKFISVTILALGTSLPELVTSVVAGLKGRGQLALGNILGSNVFNLLLILGLCGLASPVSPISFASMNLVDMGTLLASAVLIWLSAYTFQRDRIDRYDGSLMLLCYAAYMVWLFMKL